MVAPLNSMSLLIVEWCKARSATSRPDADVTSTASISISSLFNIAAHIACFFCFFLVEKEESSSFKFPSEVGGGHECVCVCVTVCHTSHRYTRTHTQGRECVCHTHTPVHIYARTRMSLTNVSPSLPPPLPPAPSLPPSLPSSPPHLLLSSPPPLPPSLRLPPLHLSATACQHPAHENSPPPCRLTPCYPLTPCLPISLRSSHTP